MKKSLRTALDKALGAQVPAVLGPQYRRLKPLPKDPTHLVREGEIVFADTSGPRSARFLCFIPDPKRQAFTIELGWSADGQFPVASARPSTGPLEAVSAGLTHGFVRLSELYTRLGTDWDVAPITPEDPASLERFMALEMSALDPEEAAALIEPLLTDALRRVQQHAPAFFDALEGATRSGEA